MAGPFLSDRSLHAQIGNKLADTDDGRPVLDYVVTFTALILRHQRTGRW